MTQQLFVETELARLEWESPALFDSVHTGGKITQPTRLTVPALRELEPQPELCLERGDDAAA